MPLPGGLSLCSCRRSTFPSLVLRQIQNLPLCLVPQVTSYCSWCSCKWLLSNTNTEKLILEVLPQFVSIKGTKLLLEHKPCPSLIHRITSRRKNRINEKPRKSLETFPQKQPSICLLQELWGLRDPISKMHDLLTTQEYQELKYIFILFQHPHATTAGPASSAAVAISAHVNQITGSKIGKPVP